MIVVDTNVIAYLYLDSAETTLAEKVLSADPEWASPVLWRSEFRNVLVHYLRAGILSPEKALEIVERAELRMYAREYQVPSERVLLLAASSKCSAYDCEFVALAQELGVKLVTADRRVISEFPQTARPLDAFGR